MPNINTNRRIIFSNNEINYDPAAEAYFTRAGITNTREKNAVNTFFVSARANTNIWSAITGGALYLVSPTSYGASLFNAISNSFNPSEGVAPNYSTTNGWSFDGVTQYLKTGLIPSTTLTNHSHTTIMALKGSTNGGSGQMGASNSTTQRLSWKQRSATDIALLTAYATATQYTPTNTDSDGYFTFSQNGNTFREIVRNGVSLGTSGSGGNGTLPSIELYLGALNNAGTASLFHYAEMISFVQTTVYLSKSDSDYLVTLLQTYNANVISGGR